MGSTIVMPARIFLCHFIFLKFIPRGEVLIVNHESNLGYEILDIDVYCFSSVEDGHVE